MTMAPKRVMILGNSEHGAFNVFLAVSHALLQTEPSLEIHIVSFAPIAGDVSSTSTYAQRCSPAATPITFHELPFPCLTETMLKDEPRLWELIGARPSMLTTPKYARLIGRFFMPWNATMYVRLYRRVAELVDQVKPDLALLDPLFSAGWTTCREAGIPACQIMPNSLKDAAGPDQPWGRVFWKYPAFGSGLAYPVPWYHIPLNIFINLCLGLNVLFDSRTNAVINEAKKALGINIITARDFMGKPPPHPLILGCCREIDYPIGPINDRIMPCGPIVRPAPPVQDQDPELAAWLQRRPTVFINLGTIASSTEADAIEMAGAVRALLDDARAGGGDLAELQVLWKLKRSGAYSTEAGSALHGLLGAEMDRDVVRVVPWVGPEPLAVLESGRVVCSVNHGGAGSYNDAVCAGVPQVVLPVWADTYDYAHRVEWLGIGRWGSRRAHPKCRADELGPVLRDVVLGPGAEAMRRKARELAEVCAARGEGRDKAAREVLALLGTPTSL